MKRISRRAALALGGQAAVLAALAGCASATPTLGPMVETPGALATNTAVPATVASATTAPGATDVPGATDDASVTDVPSATEDPGATEMPTTVSDANVDLDTKIGQMIMLGFRGFEVGAGDPIEGDIGERLVGSVVLFNYDTILKAYTRNIESPAELKTLDGQLQALAGTTPLLISLDQEGGIVNRLREKDGFPATQSQEYYGAQNDVNLTRAAAQAEGKVLKEAGINLVLAPVVDLALNPDNPIIAKVERLSADPKVVTAQATAEIEGYHAEGILTTLKHFPGHGSSASDSHLGFVDVTTTWQEIELEPYRNLIKAGLADAIMTAHIFNSNLDPKYPATLSKNVITGILREQLGWDGVVITDDMQMGAIRQYFGFEEAIELAINAGVDILAIANNTIFDPEVGAKAVGIVKQLVADGKVSEARIDQSYQRVMKLKARLS